jgi:protoporphyrinogen oxidase
MNNIATLANSKKHILILGAGPAGLGAASQLGKRNNLRVSVLERNERVGGNAGSFLLDGIYVDFGSHRLHPSCAPEILADIRSMLGDDLLDRPRHGRIRLQGRWIHFPLKPLDLAFRLPPTFALGVAKDISRKLIYRKPASDQGENFASVMEHNLGQTIGQEFYIPYAKKIWGIDPQALSAIQARRRVSAGSLSKMARKVLSSIPGFKPPGSGRFYYPRRGFGQISETYYQSAVKAGVNVVLNASVVSIDLTSEKAIVSFNRSGSVEELVVDQVWSTIPITALVKSLKPLPPEDILSAATNLDYRAMILVYLVLEQNRFSEFDAHYFPEAGIPITRLSEPKNYSNNEEPRYRTVLCAELPCSTDDPWWSMSDADLGQLVCDALAKAGMPVQVKMLSTHSRRLRYAYPIYRQGYDEYFDRLDEWIGQFDRLLTFGRQGLFAHDNTHHALFMAYSAALCVDADGSFNQAEWKNMRKVFESHVVED